MEAGTQEGQRLASLADFWMFEHLLTLPASIADKEIVNHLGSLFPPRESDNASMPAALISRMLLHHVRTEGFDSMSELLQLLGTLLVLSQKQHQFSSRAAARSIVPPAELVNEVLLQCLCSQADPSRADQGSQQQSQQPALTAADVNTRAQELLDNAEMGHLQEDEMLLNRLSMLEQLLRGCRDTAQLQRHLMDNFPADAVEEQLREYLDKAMSGLGPSTLQVYQEGVLSGRLPAHPFQHFAALMPISTQQAFEAAVPDPAAAEKQAGMPVRGRQQQQLRGSGPVSLLPEATAPVLGTQELYARPSGSSDAKRAGRGGRQQQAAAAAASPKPNPSPKPGAAAGGGGGDGGDAEPVGRKTRAAAGQKAAKEPNQDAPAGGRPSRKQLQLEPTSATAAAAPAAAAGVEQKDDQDAAAAAAGGSRKGRRSRKQQQQQEAAPDSELIGTEDAVPAAAAAAAAAGGTSGGRKRRLPAPAAAAAAAAEEQGEEEEEEGAQVMEGSQPDASEGVAAAGGSGAAVGKGRGIASAFMEVLAAVRRSPSGAAGRKSQKLCGAPEQGVRGKTVEWTSPLGGSIDSPEDSPKQLTQAAHAAKQAAAAAVAAGGRPTSALKRKRGHDEGGQRGSGAAGRAAGRAAVVDSGNTEYEDAQEEAGSESEGARGGRGRKAQGGRKGGRPRKSRREDGDDVGDDSYIEDPESEESESESRGAGKFDFDDSDDDLELGQGRQQRGKQRSGGAAATGRGGGGAAGRGAAAAAAGGPRSRPVGVETFSDTDGGPRSPAGHKKRRKVQKWSNEEVSLLMRLVARHGVGSWANILDCGGNGFNRRTQVDLKDKWRNLSKKTG